MTLLIPQLIKRVRKHVPQLQSRFAGMSDASKWLENAAQYFPFGFVFPVNTVVQQDFGDKDNGRNLDLLYGFRCTVFIKGAGDDRNQRAVSSAHPIRNAMLKALHGYHPGEPFEECKFTGMAVGEQKREFSEWIFDFSVLEHYCHEGIDDLDELAAMAGGSVGDMTGNYPNAGYVGDPCPEDPCDPPTPASFWTNLKKEEATCP